MATLNRKELLHLARHGAHVLLHQLREQIAAIEHTFPDLRGRRALSRRGKGRRAAAQTSGDAAKTTKKTKTRGRRGWTAAQRQAAADRMKAYWAKRKARKK